MFHLWGMDLTIRPALSPHTQLTRLYLDFDSFFASAEQHFNPALRGKPLGVVPLDSPYTGCIAISREAKRRGLKSNVSVIDARKAVPDMIFVVARPDAYVRLHHRILTVIETCLPIAKVRSIDELVCHLLRSETQDVVALAQRIKQALATQFSSTLTCSIGIASTELLAKIGAELNKPDGLIILLDDDLPDRLNHLPLTRIPGISKGIEARLQAAGISTFSALWQLGPKHLRALWGNVEGERFWNSLHGEHIERPPTVKRMFGHSRILPADWRSPDKVHECARQLALSAGRRLRRANLKASRLTVGLRTKSYGRDSATDNVPLRWSHEIAFPPARDDRTFLHAVSEALAVHKAQALFRPRTVSVVIHGLVAPAEMQGDLFTPVTGEPGHHMMSGSIQKWEKLSDTLDFLRTRHGPSAASLGPQASIPGGYLGGKIAFGRIPELADFNEMQTEDEATHFCSS